MIIQCEENTDLWAVDDIERIEALHNITTPINGTLVLLGPYAAEVGAHKHNDCINTLNVGFNSSNLHNIISRLQMQNQQ